jgi:hypothetical protein
MKYSVITDFVGSTIRTTMVCSGATISPIYSALYDATDALINSVAATSSGNGHYYADHLLPTSPGHYLNEVGGVIGVNTYRRYQLVEARRPRIV